MRGRTTFEKRRKEMQRKERKQGKAERREQRKVEKSERDPSEEDVEDPDIAGIVPGPQPLPEEFWAETPTPEPADKS
jgi:hypothetical protein